MKQFNSDEQTQMSEPIEVTIEKKTYTVTKISTPTLKAIEELGKQPTSETPIKQLSLLLGVDEKEFAGVDIRKIGSVINFITATIRDSVKNA